MPMPPLQDRNLCSLYEAIRESAIVWFVSGRQSQSESKPFQVNTHMLAAIVGSSYAAPVLLLLCNSIDTQ